MWFFVIPILTVTLVFVLLIFLALSKKSKSRKIYATIVLLSTYIFFFRFACDNISCITNVFLGDINSQCQQICKQCNSVAEGDISIYYYKENENKCQACSMCRPDWNVRAAFDPAGLVYLGIILAMVFLYRKNYSLKAFLEGLDTINLFGVLSFKVSQIEKVVGELSDDMGTEPIDQDTQEKISEITESIHRNSRTAFDTLHLFIDKIEQEYRKIKDVLEKTESVINFRKQQQFKKLTKAIQGLLGLVKQDWANKYINITVRLAKKILIFLYRFKDYLKSSPPTTNPRYLNYDMGVSTVGDVHSKILKKGSKVPAGNFITLYTVQENQPSIKSTILFGSSSTASESEKIGVMEITGLPKLPAKEATITVHFKIDRDGMLIAKQICNTTKNVVQVEFDVNRLLGTES